MINPKDVRTWVRQGSECLQNKRATPSFVEAHLCGLRSLRSHPDALEVYRALEGHLDAMKKRWARQKA